MSPDAAIDLSAWVADAKLLLTYLVGLTFVLAYAIWWLVARVEAGCPSCVHCARRRDAK